MYCSSTPSTPWVAVNATAPTASKTSSVILFSEPNRGTRISGNGRSPSTLSNMIASGQGNSKLKREASKVSKSARIASFQYGRRYGKILRKVSQDRFTASPPPLRHIPTPEVRLRGQRRILASLRPPHHCV